MESDGALVGGERYATAVNRVFGNQMLDLPVNVLPIQFYIYWHETTDQDSAGHWPRRTSKLQDGVMCAVHVTHP
jgi:hypothetical protein